MTGSTLFPAEHVCAVHIFSDWKRCNNSSQRIAKIIDNRGNAGYVQKEDAEDLDDMKVGDKIFQLFLGMDHSRLTNIIHLKRRHHRDSQYHYAVETERQLSNRRVTRQSKVKAKVATQGEKKVKKKVIKRHKTLEKVSITRQFVVNDQVHIQKDKKVMIAPPRKRKPMDKILEKYAKKLMGSPRK